MPDCSPTVAALIEGMEEAAAKHPDPFGMLVPFLKGAIDSNIDAYLLNAAWSRLSPVPSHGEFH